MSFFRLMDFVAMAEFEERLERVTINGRSIATVFHAASKKRVVLLCHGFRGSKIGPNRLFVRLARRLQQDSVCSLRFDQYGSGDSEGRFIDSSFDDWVTTTRMLAERHLLQGNQVALVGQSMGGSAVIAAASAFGGRISSVVAWVPDPSIDIAEENGPYHEEGGQRVGWQFWREAHNANIVRCFHEIVSPTLVFFAEEDEYVSAENQRALNEIQQPHQRIELLHHHSHSSWTCGQAEQVIQKSACFLLSHFQ
ncbi:MAG: alpha/beta hydrolase [Thermomicrobiales bacterium]